ncbi:MAG TPA: GNAT family N-acetyltransferase [Vitreimonas sp.]|uniref:GNAT family N-acetyltransferase n=1 Tax=Vitreimonas sp. TaxID=3069702 RepID=UPI002D56BA03|nr:GNAT family N-acetyltransferase [Vitreimonas sp.]HYD86010.1 GNAT family N-acetyltransferase [Vitreimonas sp.]
MTHCDAALPLLYSGPPANHVEIDIVRDLDGLVRVFALRALIYMGEQRCPFDEEFDGNDLAASTHLIARIDGEPVGTLRLRWFADFVKIERVAVKSEHRGGAVVRSLFGEAVRLASRRGYKRAIGHIQARLAPFWLRLGFAPRPGRERFYFSDHEYIEVEGRMDPHPEALSADTTPLVLLRPEGRWDAPGPLDRSSARPATNPC